MANVVDIIVRGQDNASKVLQSVGDSAKKLGSSVGGVSNSISNRAETNRASFQKMATYGGVAFTAITAFAYKGLKAYQEVERAGRQLENVILNVSKGTKGQVEEIKKLTYQLEKKVGLDAEALNMGVAQLSTFGLQTKSVIDLTKSLADLTLNQDGLNATSDQYITNANIMAKVINGQFGALEKMGIRFTEAQQNLINFGTEAEKVKAIQEGLTQNLRETTDTVGGFDVSMAKVQRNVESIGDAVGKALAPALTVMLEKITPIIGKVAEWAEDNEKLVGNIILVSGAIAGVVAILGTIGLVLPSVITGIKLLNTALFSNPIVAFSGGVSLLLISLGKLAENLPTTESKVNSYRQEMESLRIEYEAGRISLQEYQDGIASRQGQIQQAEIDSKKLGQVMTDSLGESFKILYAPVKSITGAFESFGVIVNSIGTGLDNLVATIGNFVINGVMYLYNETSNILGSLSNLLSTFVNNVKSTFNGMVDWIVTIVNKVRDAVAQIKALIASIPSKAMSIAGNIGNAVSSVFKASGGPVQAGQKYIVGEQGPEQFIPAVPGYIVPNNKMNSNSININLGSVNVYNDADENRLVDKIKKTLTRELELYKMGVY